MKRAARDYSTIPISIRLMRLRARTLLALSPYLFPSFSLHVFHVGYLTLFAVAQLVVVYALVRKDNARASIRPRLHRGFVLYELGSLDAIKSSRRGNQGMTLA